MVRTKNSKKILHIFYLLQPLVQFLGLIALIAFLSRCSPLAPSTPKDMGSPSIANQLTQDPNNANVSKVLTQDQIKKNLQDLGTSEGRFVSDSELPKLLTNAINSESSISASLVQSRFEEKLHSEDPLGHVEKDPLLSIVLNKDELDSLVQNGDLQVDLATHLAANDKSVQKLLFQSLQQSLAKQFNINADSFVVLPASRMSAEYNEVKMPLAISIAIIGDNSGVLQLQRDTPPDGHVENAALFESAIRDAKQLVIVLE